MKNEERQHKKKIILTFFSSTQVSNWYFNN